MAEILSEYQRAQLREKLADEAVIASMYGAEAEVYPAEGHQAMEYWCEHCPQYGECVVCGQRHI